MYVICILPSAFDFDFFSRSNYVLDILSNCSTSSCSKGLFLLVSRDQDLELNKINDNSNDMSHRRSNTRNTIGLQLLEPRGPSY